MISRILLAKIAIVGICVVGLADAFLAIPAKEVPTRLFSSATAAGTAPMLKSLLKKPSKVLTVGVEYSPEKSQADEVLSMKLRQQAKVSFVVCQDLAAIQLLSKEQESARGNFPGPVPIVCETQTVENNVVQEISESGASAVILDAGASDALQKAESASSCGLETIWKVSSVDQAKQVLEAFEDADIFLLDDTESMAEILEIIPKSSMSIGTLHEPMQEDGAEIETGKEYKKMGCASILVKKACIGDKEDIDYASFLVSGLTSKASSEFKFSGMTGSINGHYGGLAANGSVKWDRTARLAKEKKESEEEDDDE